MVFLQILCYNLNVDIQLAIISNTSNLPANDINKYMTLYTNRRDTTLKLKKVIKEGNFKVKGQPFQNNQVDLKK